MTPGLYVATVRGVEGVTVYGPFGWESSGDVAYLCDVDPTHRYYSDAPGDVVADLRPLVVLDPENDDDVMRFYRAWQNEPDYTPADIQQALRALANPPAPKPTEPTGLGAVVRDKDGVVWVRARNDPHEWRVPNETGLAVRYQGWHEIHAREVLSEGWTDGDA